MTEYWSKKFGYGATPINWKGWLSSFALICAVLAVTRLMVVPAAGGPIPPVWEIVAGVAIILGLIVGFSWFAKGKTDGEWRWRWGERK
jgi:hypothetical protein